MFKKGEIVFAKENITNISGSLTFFEGEKLNIIDDEDDFGCVGLSNINGKEMWSCSGSIAYELKKGYFDTDNDCHWYFIPPEHYEEFKTLIEDEDCWMKDEWNKFEEMMCDSPHGKLMRIL